MNADGPPPSEPPHTPGQASVHVATLNLWGRFADWSDRLAVLSASWGERRVDVLFLQEVIAGASFDQAEEVAQRLGFSAVASTARPETGTGEGVAVLSRHPLRVREPQVLPESDGSRRAAVADLWLAGRWITLVSAHAVPVPEARRREQARALMARNETPLIIGADLNETPDQIAAMVGRHSLTDSLDSEPSAVTWPISEHAFRAGWEAEFGIAPGFSLAPKRVDYLLSRGVEVRRSGVDPLESGGRNPSDHAMVWAEYRLPPASSNR